MRGTYKLYLGLFKTFFIDISDEKNVLEETKTQEEDESNFEITVF